MSWMNAEYLGRTEVDSRSDEVAVGYAEDLEREYSVWVTENSFGIGGVEVTVRTSEGATFDYVPEGRLGIHGEGTNASLVRGEGETGMPGDDDEIEAIVRGLKAEHGL